MQLQKRMNDNQLKLIQDFLDMLCFDDMHKFLALYVKLQVLDAYALIGDVSGLAEKIQSFFMQEVLTETHSVLKTIVQEVWL